MQTFRQEDQALISQHKRCYCGCHTKRFNFAICGLLAANFVLSLLVVILLAQNHQMAKRQEQECVDTKAEVLTVKKAMEGASARITLIETEQALLWGNITTLDQSLGRSNQNLDQVNKAQTALKAEVEGASASITLIETKQEILWGNITILDKSLSLSNQNLDQVSKAQTALKAEVELAKKNQPDWTQPVTLVSATNYQTATCPPGKHAVWFMCTTPNGQLYLAAYGDGMSTTNLRCHPNVPASQILLFCL